MTLPRHASFARRAFAATFDTLLITLVVVVLTAPFIPTFERLGTYLANNTSFEARKSFLEVRDTVRDIALISWFVYSAILEASFLQGTLGKRMLGIKVINFSGEKITFLQSFQRSFTKFFSLIPLGLGFLWALFTRKHLTWHDLAAKTVVIQPGKSILPCRNHA